MTAATPLRRSVMVGHGSYLPANIVSNDALAAKVDTSDAWIRERSGIHQRHIAAEGETTADLATAAATQALERAGLTAEAIDLVLVATATPDHTFPATATKVQAALGITKGFAFDVQAVCSGFVYAMTVADSLMITGQAQRSLVIGAETFSRILDWEDRSTCVLFGDGAGAVVLEAQKGQGTLDDRGVLASRLHADGRHHDLLYVDGGPSTTGTAGFVRMEGREVFRHAVTNMSTVLDEVLAETGLPVSAIDWLVPHQANQRIIEATAKKIGLPPERVIMTVDRHANTSAASIPLALDDAMSAGTIKGGDLVMLEAMGGGMTWGALLLRV